MIRYKHGSFELVIKGRVILRSQSLEYIRAMYMAWAA